MTAREPADDSLPPVGGGESYDPLLVAQGDAGSLTLYWATMADAEGRVGSGYPAILDVSDGPERRRYEGRVFGLDEPGRAITFSVRVDREDASEVASLVGGAGRRLPRFADLLRVTSWDLGEAVMEGMYLPPKAAAWVATLYADARRLRETRTSDPRPEYAARAEAVRVGRQYGQEITLNIEWMDPSIESALAARQPREAPKNQGPRL